MSPSKNHFDELVAVIDRLLAPDGCPWDREQTVRSVSHMVLEEVCEVIDTLEEKDPEKLADELGDVLIGALFLAKTAEKEHRFPWGLPFQKAVAKLIRRHPHIFTDEQNMATAAEVEKRWDEIKTTEAEHAHRSSRLDGIPKSLPALAMMQKLMTKIKKAPPLGQIAQEFLEKPREDQEEEIGRKISQLVVEADRQGIQAEQALRRFFFCCRGVLQQQERAVETER